MKRLTPLSHYWRGATLGLSPIAGWLAVDPARAGLPALLLFCAVTTWVAAFDIYYALQDMEIDRKTGLHSLPADWGAETALRFAGFSHALTFVFLLLTGCAAGLGWPWYAVCLAIGGILFWEHRLVKPDDLSKINMAFFTLNGVVSFAMLLGIILGLYF